MTNVDQAAFWNGPGGERWVREQAQLDSTLRAYGEAALAAAQVAPGEAVIDVGCGCGDTSLALAERAGAGGRVVALDVSAPMLARARSRLAAHPNVSFVLGDAARAELAPATFDLLFSRFGVMFFDEPARAFSHLRAALKPGGRLAFICWRALAENPWARVPLEAAMTVVGRPPPSPPDAPGPFAFGDRARVLRILAEAGFRDVAARPFDRPMRMGLAARLTLDDAVEHSLTVGPAARLVGDQDEATVTRVRVAIRAAFEPFEREDGVHLDSACWVVVARS